MSSVRILFLAANPSTTAKLALDEECAAIERELRLAEHRDFQFVSRWAVTVDELMRHFNELQPTVIHFSGHGATSVPAPDGSAQTLRDVIGLDDRARDQGGIYLHDERGREQLVTGDALTKMIKAASSSARLVVLNACYTESQAAVVCSAVDCVVGMVHAIDDESARAFAVAFYRALGNRRSVGNAVEQAIATLAAKRLPGEHQPRCRCRGGLEPAQVFLSKPTTSDLSWPQRFDAVIRLCREAHDRLEADPWSAAQRARSAIEHIVTYLHERELGPADPDDTLRTRLNRIEAKLVIPPMVADHVEFVQGHTNSVIRTGGMATRPDPDLLQPCLGSLAIVVRWFFRDYLKQATPNLELEPAAWRSAERPPIPDLTPLNSTSGTAMNTQFGTGIGEFMPIWRRQSNASILRLEADSDPTDHRAFKIEDPARVYTIGRTERRRDGTLNDFVLPRSWSSISRDQGTIAIKEGGVMLINSSSKDNVLVRGEVVAQGAARWIRHGDLVQLGRCVGTFSDGRYYAATPSAAIDWRTGLLSRIGLVAEVSGCLAAGTQPLLFVVRCPDGTLSTRQMRPDPEQLAAAIAMAIHHHDPSRPIARIGVDVAILLTSADAVTGVAMIADRIAGTPCVSGFMTLEGTADQASPRIEACLGALSRIAIAGRDAVGPKDLARYALMPTPLAAFADHAQRLFDSGGGAILFVLGDLPRLKQEAPHAVSVLELELIEMLGARMGPRDVVSFAGPGMLLFGTRGDVETFAHDIGVTWHARGPVTANAIEIDRCLLAHLLTSSDLDDMAERASALAQGESCALGASGLPAPLALAASAVDQTRDPVERARALVHLAEVSWKLLAFILVACARGVDAGPGTSDPATVPDVWPAPWRSVARDTSRRLAGQPGRVTELAEVAVSADRDEAFRTAIDVIAATAQLVATPDADATVVARGLPRLEQAVRKLFAVLGPLRGWTLVALTDAEFDVEGISQRIDYVDYTGPSARGSQQRITVMGFRGLGRFSFLVRWNEGLAIALEPFVRRVRNAATGDHELFLAKALISEPGHQLYRSANSLHEIQQSVTAKQLGASTTRRHSDGAAEG
jgi:hypothetical protein